MNWDELSMSEKSDLMKTYIRNGVTSLDMMRGHFNSFATGGTKKTYQEWVSAMTSKYPWLEMNSANAGYDYERYFNENYQDAISRLTEPEPRHFTDKYKLPSHITFSDESVYSTPRNKGGRWVGDDMFMPSPANVERYPWLYKAYRPVSEEDIYSHRFATGGPKDKWRKLVYGSDEATRQRIYNEFPTLVRATDSIAGEYGISPKLLRTRMAEEGFIDELGRDVESRIAAGDTLMSKNEYINAILNTEDFGVKENEGTGFGYFGLDDSSTFIDEGKVKPIRERYNTKYNVNRLGREVETADGVTVLDNMGLMAATLKYLKGKAKEFYPDASENELEKYANTMYHRGVAGGSQYIKNRGKYDKKYELKYSYGGKLKKK